MKKLFAFAILIIGLGSVSAQSYVKRFPVDIQNINSFNNSDSLKILAVMVEFQEDRYDATVGNGKFGSVFTQEYGDTIIDPLPHDAQYFEDHLLFAKNYYKKVSKGKVNLSYKVLPEVITVSKYMRDYVPEYNTDDFTPTGYFTKEVWEIADQKFTNVNFSEYDLFIIFHAGVSAGIDLGYFTIDRNLPSVYLSNSTLKKIFGNDFTGIPVNNGSAFVTNSIIMAETESRETEDITGKIYVDQFSINGFLVNNIASYLGIPDLFNTSTGRSVIGRFGLMDSQGLNANYGMFPPEPSPWEKIYMGWETPVVLSNMDQRVNISERLTASASDTTLLKIPINSSEYFLIENRSQDALKDFVKITYKRSGNVYTKVIQPDTSGYYYIVPDSIEGGVVIDVDEFDAAVPGNGIVIWHIDENVINQNIADNKINAGEVKGVKIIEADGIIDIGEFYDTIFGTFIGEGSYEDLWYKGNEAKLYKNKFSSDTKPNSNSNSGAKSLLTLENFSEVANKMGFNIRWGSNDLKLVSKTFLEIGESKRFVSSFISNNSSQIIILGNSDLSIYDLNGQLVKSIVEFSDIRPATLSFLEKGYIIGAKDNFFNIYINDSSQEIIHSVGFHGQITAVTVDYKTTIPNLIINVSGTESITHSISIEQIVNLDVVDQNSFVIHKNQKPVVNIAVGQSYVNILNENGIVEIYDGVKEIQLPSKAKKSVVSKKADGIFNTVILFEDNSFAVYENGNIFSQFDTKSEESIQSFAVADILNNGKNYIVVSNGNNIQAYDFNGAMAENYPFTIDSDEKFVGTTLIADINNDAAADIIVATEDGNVYAIDAVTTKILESFPISFGEKLAANPVLISIPLPNTDPLQTYQPMLSLLSENNDLYVWQIGNVLGKNYWSSELGDSYNSSFADIPEQVETESEYFPTAKAYNWPNPVYGNETNIRYYVTENSEVNIKIFDLAGDFVAELNGRAVGGFDNEIKWNVNNIQSGVYYARINVKSDSGKSAEKIIKIAVIK